MMQILDIHKQYPDLPEDQTKGNFMDWFTDQYDEKVTEESAPVKVLATFWKSEDGSQFQRLQTRYR